MTKAGHGLADNTVVRLTTSTTLPTGFVSTADYFVVSATADTFKLSGTSGGTPIAFTNVGSGTHSYSFPNTFASGDLVTNNAASYLTVSAHTSGSTFAGDSTYWTLIANSAIETTSASIDMRSGDGSNKVFTTTYTYAAVGDVQVFVNGALQATNLYTVTNTGGGNNITFTASTSAPSIGTNNVIIWGATVVAEAAKAGALTYSATANNHKTTADRFANLVTGSVTDAESGATAQGFSSKAYAVGGTGVTQTALLGAAKEWAIGTGRIDHQTTGGYSAKEHAEGSTVATGSSKQWALGGGSHVEATEVTTGLYSARRYASLAAADLLLTNADVVATNADLVATNQDTIDTAADLVATNQDTIDTAADLVATNQDTIDTAADLVATNQDTIDTAADLVATNQDTIDTAADVVLTNADVVLTNADVVLTHADEVLTRADTVLTAADVVTTTASEVAARASAAAVSQTFDNFADVYLGSMADGATADTGTLTGASWAKDSSSIAFTGTTGTISLGQELTTVASGYPVNANIIGSSVSTPLVISNSFTASGTGATLNFVGSGVYGAYDASKDGPGFDNDGDALAVGMLYFNTTDNEMRIYGGSTWIAASAAGSASLLIYKYIATAAQTSFTGNDAGGATLSYTTNNINVYLNGVRLDASDYTATSGTSVVLGSGAAVSDELVVVAFKSFTVADMVPASTGGTFTGAVTASGGVVGNLTGNASGTAATVTGATQSAITTATNLTSVGTLTAATVTGLITANGGLETDTNSKIKQKGAFMQSSTHQAMVLGG
jgi:hypothetical protein